MDHSIGLSLNEEHAERESSDVLLFGQAAIHREEGLELSLCLRQELTVFEARPAAAGYGFDLVADQERREIVGEVLVKENAHYRAPIRALAL